MQFWKCISMQPNVYISRNKKTNFKELFKPLKKTPMIKSYSDLVKKIDDKNQIFVIANTQGNVSVAGNPGNSSDTYASIDGVSNQLRGKFFKPTDRKSVV